MFGNNKTKSVGATSEENNTINTYDLFVENEKLKIKVETLNFKLEQANEKYAIIEQKLRQLSTAEFERMKEENETLKKRLKNLEFNIENDTKNIELETENKKLKSQVEIQHAENKHLKELLDAYRAMPDVRAMIDNLSGLAVPSMEELKSFAKMISDSKVSQLCDELAKTNEKMNIMIDDRYGSGFNARKW